MRGSFSILEFGPADPRVVYVDSLAGNLFLEKDRQVRQFLHIYNRLRAGALDPEESMALIGSAAKERK